MKNDGHVMTVTGAVDASDLGFTLPHEHVLVDFIGAREVGAHRYDADDVVATMDPPLRQLVELGVHAFVDCTPMYLARDPGVLKRLSQQTGLKIITNTGQYKPPYLPDRTFDINAETLAGEWIAECNDGIAGTGVSPGFIKTAVDPGVLPDIIRKTISAAAITSSETGLTIGTHCGNGLAAREILTILNSYNVSPGKWIFIHAQNESDHDQLLRAASEGAWIELDGIGQGEDENHLVPLLKLLDAGYERQVLLSQDAGWYEVGSSPDHPRKPYTYIVTDFLPMLGRYGIDRRVIDQIMVDNPARALRIGSPV